MGEDLIGKKFGRLTVCERAEDIVTEGGKRKRRMWKCLCECGNYITTRETSLKGGVTKSCGCLRTEMYGSYNRVHGGFGTRLYTIWNSMRQRCNNKNCHAYHNYGGRGITICPEWDDYAVFRDWAYKNGYEDNAEYGKYTLDRIDVNGNYCPDNCKWSTMKEQGNNRRDTIYVTVNGETHSLHEWADITGLKYPTVWRRYKKYKDSPEKIIAPI